MDRSLLIAACSRRRASRPLRWPCCGARRRRAPPPATRRARRPRRAAPAPPPAATPPAPRRRRRPSPQRRPPHTAGARPLHQPEPRRRRGGRGGAATRRLHRRRLPPSCRRRSRRSFRRRRRRPIRASASRPAAGTRHRPRGTCACSRRRRRGDESLGATHSDLAFSGNLRDSGQLQRLRDLRHLQSCEAGAHADVSVSGVAERRVGLPEPALHVRRRRPTAARTAGSKACPSRSASCACAASASSTSRDVKHPKLVTTVQTCRGSHTHTVVTQAGRRWQRVHLCVGHVGRAVGRRGAGMRGRRHRRSEYRALPSGSDQGAARAPEQAAIVSSPRIFQGLPVPPRNRGARRVGRARSPGGGSGRGCGRGPGRQAGRAAARRPRQRSGPPTGPNQCHDITVYPDIGLAGGRLRRPRPSARHPRPVTPRPHRRGGRRQHVVLALGDVQQRRHEGALHR